MIPMLAAAAFSAALDVSAVRAPYARVHIPVAADPTPDHNYRDLRVRDDRGVEIPYALDPRPPDPHTVAVRTAGFERPADAPAVQRATLDLSASNLAVASLRFDTSTPAFARDVLIEHSDDGATWSGNVTERISRFRVGTPHLALDVADGSARFWRVSIDDRDDAPLENLRVTLYATAHEIVFPVVRGRRYALTFGDPGPAAPVYDLPARLEHERWRADTASVRRVVALSPRSSDVPAVSPPARAAPAARASPEAPPWLVPVAFGAAVVVLAAFALRLTRTPETTGTGSE
ncbi:MAG: hypothetical protein JWM87_1966 [Candidatus Eremiobacteraeota bacterium]|nr:hypothetical protein [Candidatus Eremiobacteraeota bacterium]